MVTVGSPGHLAGLKINVSSPSEGSAKKVKPPPPPRSSQTKLSSVACPKPKSILSPTSSLNNLELSPTEALDNLIRNVDNNRSKKRVKFNPQVDIDSMKPIDPNFLHFLPAPAKASSQDLDKKSADFSYYEPYL